MNFVFDLNWADYVIIGILSFSVLVGMLRGFIREVLTIAVWILAFYVAFAYANTVSGMLGGAIENLSMRYIVSFVLLLVCMIFVGAVINYLLGRILKTTGLSGTDRVLGLCFGLARGILLIGVMVMFAMHTTLIDDPWWKESKMMSEFEQVGESVKGYLPEDWSKWLNNLKKEAIDVINKQDDEQKEKNQP